MQRFFISVVAAGLLLGITGPEPQWKMTAATDVRAYQSNGGVVISASIDLQNACWEAKIVEWPGDVHPAQYQVVTRTKPEDVGKMCTMAIVPSVASGWFAIKQSSVTVHATNRTFIVKVTP